jgi:hypothetical protein
MGKIRTLWSAVWRWVNHLSNAQFLLSFLPSGLVGTVVGWLVPAELWLRILLGFFAFLLVFVLWLGASIYRIALKEAANPIAAQGPNDYFSDAFARRKAEALAEALMPSRPAPPQEAPQWRGPRLQGRSGPPKPDVPLTDVVARVYELIGPPPPPGEDRKVFWRRVNLEIADKVSINGLHVWGRHGDRALSEITVHWSNGHFDHRKGTLTVLLNSYVGEPFDYTDLHFNGEEIEKTWPKSKNAETFVEPEAVESNEDTPEFPAPYKKAVLQLQKPVVTKTASGGRVSEITSVECTLMIEGKAAIKDGRIWLGELRSAGGSVALNTYVRIGRRGEKMFAIHRAGSTARVILVRRDMTDIVSKPPFLLYTERGDFPLSEDTQYHLNLELRSEAEHPTKVALLIHTGSGHELDAAIESQSV